MNAAGWAMLKEWFGRAVDAAPDEVTEIVRAAERDLPGLGAELRSLLREHAMQDLQAADVPAQAPLRVEVHPLEAPAGGIIGPYRIIRELGRGGTGVVFHAERADDEFHRPVALKVLRFASWDRRSHEALTKERRVLSRLQHPNIAALLDWGDPPEGAPWLATEYVEGVPIDRYCHARGLDVDGLLAVFEQVCQAVLYAHRRLVVHRDLKPANILVTASGIVKLLDFGISKPIQDLSITLPSERQYTPAYASPEQILGEPVSAASDVYSLGLVLYELLAGVQPHETRTMEELVRRLQDREFAPPSAAPGVSRARQRAIRGDLDRVVLHALERDPEKRYPSVEQLQVDVHAYRLGYPVSARRIGPLGRSWKFVRRHALPVALGVLVVVAMAAGTAVSVWNTRVARQEQQMADRRFRQLQSLAHSVMFDLHDSIRRLPGSVDARRQLITTAVTYLDGLNAERVNDEGLQRELAAGYVRMAYVQGGAAGVNLGDTAGSVKSYRAALHILDDQWRRHPGDEAIGAMRFGAAYNLSMMINDPASGGELATRYADEAEAWAQQNQNAAPLQAVELLLSALGRIYRYGGELDESIRSFDRAADAQRRMMPKTAGDTAPRPMFGVSVDVGQGLFDSGLTSFARAETLLEMGKPEEAFGSVEHARMLFEQATRAGQSGPSDQRMFARLHDLKAVTLLELTRIDEALAEARTALAAAQANTADGSATAQRDLAETLRCTGHILLAKGDGAGARDHLKEAVATMSRLADVDPAFLLNRALLAGTLNDYGHALLRARQPDQAEPIFRRALVTARRGLGEAPTWRELIRERARANAGLGSGALQRPASDHAAAYATLRQSAADWAEFQRRDPLNRRGIDEQRETEALLAPARPPIRPGPTQ